jgi:cytochrome P450
MFELLTDCLKNADTPIWKHNRKAIHLFMSPSQLEAYLPKQQVEYVHFLHDILTQPQVSPSYFLSAVQMAPPTRTEN